MILTGDEILNHFIMGDIVVDPFDEQFIEPNSYGVHLHQDLKVYKNDILYIEQENQIDTITMGPEGYVLYPGKLYLGSTVERIGSYKHTCLLYGRLSSSLCGIFIQTSAPVGHTGAIIPWTLEIVVAQPVKLYPGMLIGKVSFWENKGQISLYEGRYKDSLHAIPSLIYLD